MSPVRRRRREVLVLFVKDGRRDGSRGSQMGHGLGTQVVQWREKSEVPERSQLLFKIQKFLLNRVEQS